MEKSTILLSFFPIRPHFNALPFQLLLILFVSFFYEQYNLQIERKRRRVRMKREGGWG
jgi:hypothetical protein